MKFEVSDKVTVLLAIALLMFVGGGCGRRQTLVDIGDRTQVLRIGNGGEPGDLDPYTAIGQIEHDVMLGLFEGLVVADPKDCSPRPGVAERWDISADTTVYTFHLRKDARWSNGQPVTARDFIESHRRLLTPSLGAQYSYMLFAVKNAEAFNTGKITDFSQVGFKALDDRTLQITLHDPTPYLLSMMIHDSWYPVPVATIQKYGRIDDRSNPWTRPEHFVGNGPFVLKEWKMNSHILLEKSPTYWDAKNVRLNQIYFDPTESYDTEERMFRSGQLHTIRQPPPSKVDFYRKFRPDLIEIYPIISTYYYSFNTTRPPLNDKRVRQALAMAIDRQAITETITRAGEVPAYCLTPPDTAGYTAKVRIKEDVPAARALLAQAGYPDGTGFPTIELLFNTLQSHKAIAEAVQDMWKRNLNVNIVLHNEEWKVYLDSMRRLDYFIARSGWQGDYVDPSTFLEIFLSESGNSETGWTDGQYDRFVKAGCYTNDQAARLENYQKAEAILMDEMPIIPIYFYTQPRLIRPSVKNLFPNLLDSHPYKSVYLSPAPSPAPARAPGPALFPGA